MTPYELEVLARLEEISSNLAELGAWVVVAAIGIGTCAGLLCWQVVMAAKNERRFW